MMARLVSILARLVSALSTVLGGMGLINGVIGVGIARRLSDSKEPPTERYRRFGKVCTEFQDITRFPDHVPFSYTSDAPLYLITQTPDLQTPSP